MKAKIFSNEKLIGTAELKVGDRSMGHVFGEFLPTENYYTDIQPVVWEFWSTNTPDYIKWELLKLNVQLDNGYFLFAAGGITFNDISELKDEPKVLISQV